MLLGYFYVVMLLIFNMSNIRGYEPFKKTFKCCKHQKINVVYSINFCELIHKAFVILDNAQFLDHVRVKCCNIDDTTSNTDLDFVLKENFLLKKTLQEKNKLLNEQNLYIKILKGSNAYLEEKLHRLDEIQDHDKIQHKRKKFKGISRH